MPVLSPRCSVLALLFAAGAQAFAPAPIRWGGIAGKRLANGLDRFVLTTASKDVPSMAASQPQGLTLREQSGDVSPSTIPFFTAKPDNTIRTDHSVCLEASGDKSGDSVRLNQCNGGDTQKWDWHAWGAIQLQGTNQCVGVSENSGFSVSGAPVELKECDNQMAETWMFEEAQPLNELQYPDLLFRLATLYWGGLGAAFLLAMYDKLTSKGAHAQSQPLVHGARVAAVMAIKPVVDARAAPPKMLVTETTTRSAVKAVGWRLTAGVVTACTSMIFTGSLATAAAIVGWDLCSKSVTMFLGERLWNKVDWGKDKGEDSSKRSLVKALAWRVFAAFNTLFASIVITKGSASTAGKIAGTDTVVKTVLFFFYERAWAKIAWGKQTVQSDETEVKSVKQSSEDTDDIGSVSVAA